MNYEKIYEQLVLHRNTVKLSKQLDFCEEHHILPVSLGGSNNPKNLVNLLPKEHYMAHRLLEKITLTKYGKHSQQHLAMMRALWFMTINKSYEKIISNGKQYQTIRESYIKSISGKNNPQFGKRGKLSKNFGRRHTKDANEKNRSSHIGRKHMHHPTTDHEVVVHEKDIKKYLELGYIFGISKHSQTGFSASRSKAKHMFNPITDQQVFAQPNDIQKYLDAGFIFGVSEKNRKVRSKNILGRKWMNNPLTNDHKLVKADEIEEYKKNGYVLGR